MKIVKSDYTILHNLFLVFFVDEEGDGLWFSPEN